MNVLLLIVGIIFAVCIFVGYKKGLIKIVASLVATLLIILLVGMVTPYVSQWIRKATPLEATIQKKMIEMLVPEDTEESGEQLLETELRDQQISLIEGAKVPEVFQEMLLANNNNEVYETLGVNTFGEYVGAYIAKVIADIIAFLVTMLVVTIAVRIAIGMLGILDKIPVIGGMNRLAGALVGVGIGIVVVWIGFIVVTLLYDTAFGRMCFDNIETNPILSALYDSNFLMKYITKF